MARYKWNKLLIVANLGIGLAYWGYWFISFPQHRAMDFTAFYTAASLLSEGADSRLYDFALQSARQQKILGSYELGGLLAFYYPPYVAVLFAPMAWLPLRVAYGVWTCVQIILLFAYLRRLLASGLLDKWTTLARMSLVSVMIALPSMLRNLLLGQVSLLVSLCILEFVIAAKEYRTVRLGLWALLGLIKPQLMIFPILMVLASRRWYALIVMVIGAVLVALTISILFGCSIWFDFLNAVLSIMGTSGRLGVTPAFMYSVRGMLQGRVDGLPLSVVNLISMALLVIFGLYVGNLWTRSRLVKAKFDQVMSITLLCGILFGIHVNPQDGILAILPNVLFLNSLDRDQKTTCVYAAVLLLSPVLILVDEFVLPGHFYFAVLALTITLAWAIWEVGKEFRKIPGTVVK